MAADYSSRIAVTQEGDALASRQLDDPEIHKGAIEGDRPGDEQVGNPHGEGIDGNGLPNDPIAMAEDVLGQTRMRRRGKFANPPIREPDRGLQALPQSFHDLFERLRPWPHLVQWKRREWLVNDVQRRQKIVTIGLDVD